MWARVRGETENALLQLPFRAMLTAAGQGAPKQVLETRDMNAL
jgi:hypothetical protein